MIVIALAMAALACVDSGSTRRIAVAPGETLAVVRHGSGAPMVLLPGIVGSAFSYRKVIAELAASGQATIVVEPLGFGESNRPRHADYSLPAQAARVNAALDSLGVTHAIFIAQSIGVSIAYRVALAYPDRVAAMVTLDAGPLDRPNAPGISAALTFAPVMQLFGAKGYIRRKVATGLRAHSADASWVTDPVINAYAKPMLDDMTGMLSAIKSMSEAKVTDPIAPQVSSIHAPVVLLIGKANRLDGVQPEMIAMLRAAMPGFQADSVAGSGQYLQEERPDAVVAAALGLLPAAAGNAVAHADPACALDVGELGAAKGAPHQAP